MPDEVEIIPCPKGIEGHVRVKKYPMKDSSAHVTMCLDCKSAREKAVRRNPALKGTGKGQGKRPREVTFQRNAKVAGLLGAGVPLEQIAERDGRSENAIRTVIKDRILKDERLREVLDDSRRQAALSVTPKALKVTENLIDKIEERSNGYMDSIGTNKEGEVVMGMRTPGPRELAAALREVSHISGLNRTTGAAGTASPLPGMENQQSSGGQAISIEALKEVLKWAHELQTKKERVIDVERIS